MEQAGVAFVQGRRTVDGTAEDFAVLGVRYIFGDFRGVAQCGRAEQWQFLFFRECHNGFSIGE